MGSGGVLAAARELFALRGYAGVELDAIAERAGVSREDLDRRFPAGKEKVFGAVVVDLSAELFDAALDVLLRTGAVDDCGGVFVHGDTARAA